GATFTCAQHLDHRNRAGHASPEVEHLSSCLLVMAAHRHHRIDQVVDMEDIAYLEAIAAYGNGASLQHGVKEMRNPTLVLIAELPRTGDAGHPEDNRIQIVDARIIA